MPETETIPLDQIQSRILAIRGQRVVLDADLAAFYGSTTGALNQAVKRNSERFPNDFCFRLTPQEVANLKSQSVISSLAHGGRRKTPLVFTEHGALMAATLLRSAKAVQLSIVVVRAFVALRQMILDHKKFRIKLEELYARVGAHDEHIAAIIEAIRQLAIPPGVDHDRKVGFVRGTR